MTTAQIASAAFRRTGTLADALARSGWRDRWLYAVALVALVTSIFVGRITGTRPDAGIVATFGYEIAQYFFLGLSVAAGIVLFWLGRVKKSASPARDLSAILYRFFAASGRAASILHTLAVFMIFAAAFAVLKGAIAVLEPFSWDPAFAQLDRVLHFGALPHEWLMPVLGGEVPLFVLNFFYNFWFVFLVASILAVSIMVRNAALRHQYLMSFMTTWFFGGFLMATGLSSAGPCYYDLAGFGNDYADLMAHLRTVNTVLPIWAVDTQTMLWQGFTGERAGSAGISALPSMHVATAVLFALAASRINRMLGRAMWIYAGIIFVGSVLLGWHYAVDGYAGAAIALLAWWVSGRYARRFAPAMPVATTRNLLRQCA